MPYVPHSPEEVREMLDVIGVNSVDDCSLKSRQT